jgi:phage tail-like protein
VTDAPASASARDYLTGTLPAVYLEDDRPSLAPDVALPSPEPFVIRWLQGLEQVLDPAVALLDNLAWHFDPETCPDDLGRELLCWLGLEVAADLEPDARRRLLRRAMAIGRRRGTLAGLRELLELAFEDPGITVAHSGRATRDRDPAAPPPAATPPRVTVSCAGPLAPARELALRRLVDDACPARVEWTLEIGERGPGA